jgi:DNA-binding transcriptional LysR family regulator
MQWDDLKYFLALFRSGTLSAAARTLGAEHSTVARRIASLEEGLGMRLFERSGRGFSLTAEGEAIADIAARVEEETLNIARVAQGRQSDLAGVVRISAPPTFASQFIAPRLTALRRRYPGIELELAGDSRAISLSPHSADDGFDRGAADRNDGFRPLWPAGLSCENRSLRPRFSRL